LYNVFFSSENLDTYLKELAKEFRKLNGKTMPAELILIGGAAILANYGFRAMTYDIDAVISASSAMKDAINRVGDKFNLPNGWLNSDFTKTKSYSPNLRRYSKYYKTFSNILTIRTISAEYLIAMKLMSGRPYKHDLSDVAGILLEHQKRNEPLSFEVIKTAIENLYDSIENVPTHSMDFLKSALETDNLEQFILDSKESEHSSKEKLVQFEEDYKGVLNEGNLQEILESLSKREQSPSQKSVSFSRATQKTFAEKAAEKPMQQHNDKSKDDITH